MATTFAAHGTLVANVVTTVTLTRDFQRVAVLNRNGLAEISFTVDGATPTMLGDDTYVLPAAMAALEVAAPSSDATTVVKLISTAATTYSVEGVG